MSELIINFATYGDKDCTEEIRKKIKGNNLILVVDNHIIGDPSPGVVKELTISWSYKSPNKFHIPDTITKGIEGSIISIPKTNNKRLGIFYSNNEDKKMEKVIHSSLQSLYKCKINNDTESGVDIITCPWYKIKDNPFPEILSHYNSKTHLNQVLQILQLLLFSKEIREYQTVSFLEHDVLYPEGYFDYPSFNKGEVLFNKKFGGLNSNGWQDKKQNDRPLHQMTMWLDDAIEHFEKVLRNAIVYNSGLVEPDSNKWNILDWESKNRSIHINTKRGFTSHYNIYKEGNENKVDPYWGDYLDYINVFE
jgi:hypothetical protein